MDKALELFKAELHLSLQQPIGGSIIDTIGNAKKAVEVLRDAEILPTVQIFSFWASINYALTQGKKPEDFGTTIKDLKSLWKIKYVPF